MKPVQLLGLAFGAAVFTGIVTVVSMGIFQARTGEDVQRVLAVAGVAAGVAFIAVLLIVSLLLLAIDPAQVRKPVDRAVLLDEQPDAPGEPGTDAAASDDPKP